MDVDPSIVHEFMWTQGRVTFTSKACVVEQDILGDALNCGVSLGNNVIGADLGKKEWGALYMNLEKQPILCVLH